MDRMGIQKYDLNRFEAQITGISMTLDHITGYGPGQYEAAVNKALEVKFSAHSLYARVLLENGVPGFLLLMSVIFMLIVRLLRVKKYENDNSSIRSSVLVAAIISIMINSIIVDTLHWRHLWLILGLSLSVTMNCCEAGIVEFIKKIGPVYKKGSIEINIISSIEELKKYRDEWYDILNDDRCTPFTEFDFVINWWKFFNKGKNLFILRISRDEETIGFCPLIVEKRIFGNVLRFAGSPQANYMDFILDYENREKSIECIMEFLTSQKILLDFSGVPENSRNYKAVLKYLNKNKKKYFTMVEKAPLIKMNKENFEDYYKERFNNHKRKEIKRRESKLSNMGKLTYGRINMDKIDEIFSMHKKRWRKKLDESKFTDENTKKFFTFLAEKNGLSFKTCIDAIKLNGRIIAFKYGFECRCRYISYRICHDDDFALFGPGRIITKERLRECFDKGLTLYDFGPGESPYKAEWTDDYRNIMRIIFKGRGFFYSLLFITGLIKYKVKLILKRNHSIVDFKEKKLGALLYSISFENLKEKCKGIYAKVKRAGLFRSMLIILIKLKKKISSDEKYIIFSRDLTADEGYESIIKSDFNFSEFDFKDIDELSNVMHLPKESIIKRIFENKKCFVAKIENKIVQYGWVDFYSIEIKEIKFSMFLREKSAYMFDGYTDPEYRNMGLSKQGLSYISQYLIKNNYNKCYVAANERNIPSVKSCKNAGFMPEIVLRGIRIMNVLKNFSIE
jgi:CelD/BcsL family acetyltransferase involved in cellulose biosynthesis/GNAT superfamily N-acetyltransferase